jgi:flagellar biosynthesis component FlhA
LPGRLEDQVLVTEPELRPFVRWVLELEFPGLPVLSRRELLTTRNPEAVVDLEPAFAEAAR